MARLAAKRVAALACALGLGSAAVSTYWALGGTALLDTVGGSIERWGREREPALIAGLWLIVTVKVIIALATPAFGAARVCSPEPVEADAAIRRQWPELPATVRAALRV